MIETARPDSQANRSRRRDRLQAAHIRPQHLGHGDRPIRLLVVLHHRDQRAARPRRPIRSACAHTPPSCRPPRRGSARSSAAPGSPAVGAGGDLALHASGRAARPPDRTCGVEAKPVSPLHSSTRRYGSPSSSSTISAERVIHSCSSALSVGMGDADQFDLAELVLAQHAAGVAAGGPGLAAETVGQRGQRGSAAAFSATISPATVLVSGTSAVGIR